MQLYCLLVNRANSCTVSHKKCELASFVWENAADPQECELASLVWETQQAHTNVNLLRSLVWEIAAGPPKSELASLVWENVAGP